MAVTTPTAERAKPAEVPRQRDHPASREWRPPDPSEFERHYEAMPEVKKAELIDGVVHMPSPVRQRYHGRQHSHLNFWLSAYEGSTAGVEVGGNSMVQLDLDNMPQPDCLLFIQPEHGGRVQIGEKGYHRSATTWSPKSLPAAPVTTWETSSRPTGATAPANTSSGASSIGRSTGSSSTWSITSLSIGGRRPAAQSGVSRPPARSRPP